MLLVINIGNSNIHFGLFQIDNCKKSWVINSKNNYSIDEYIILLYSIYREYNIHIKYINNIIIGSVVPSLTNIIKQTIYKIHKKIPIILDRYTPSCIHHTSHELGTDIYANAIASYTLYKKTSLVIDFGTAINLSCIDNTGILKGVIIIPGIHISLNALINNTSQIFDVEIKKPTNILGLQSESCIQSGLIYGYLSMIEGLIDRVNHELNTKCLIIATGGLSHIYFPLTKKIHILDKLHTIKGLNLLYKFYNKL